MSTFCSLRTSELDADLGGVERALERVNFEPDAMEDGWGWRGPVEGWPVKLEFRCDLPDHREGEIIRPRGCANLAAANLRGTGYVARDFVWTELSGTVADGTEVRVRARFVGLEGYLLSKCVTVRTRAATRDYYDLVYVLLHNRAGGPEQAAQRLLGGGSTTHLERCVRPSSRSGHATPRRVTVGRAAMPSRHSTLSRTLTLRCSEPTPSTSCKVLRGTRHLRAGTVRNAPS